MLKKFICTLLACVFIFSLAGCSDISYTHVIEDQTIKAGVFIYYQIAAMNDFETEFKEKNPTVDITQKDFDLTAQKLDDKDYTQWVQDKTLDYCKRLVAINKLFDELGLSFTADEKAEMKREITERWDTEDASLSYYYGIDARSWGEYYTSIGISKDSLTQAYQTVFEKYEKIFHHYYDVEGDKGTTQKQIDDYFMENFARVRVVAVSLTDADGKTIESEKELKKLEEMTEEYTQRLKDGEKYSDVLNDYLAYLDELKGEDKEDKKDEDEDEEDEKEEVDENDYDRFIQKSSESPSKKFVEYVYGLKEGETGTYLDEKMYYAIIRLPLAERKDWMEETTEAVIHEMFNEEMEDYLTTLYQDYDVVTNTGALNKYAPTKIKT